MSGYFNWSCKTCGVLELHEDDKRICEASECSSEVFCDCGEACHYESIQLEEWDGAADIVEVKFDYVFQIWRKLDATPIITIEEGWDFPCPRCGGPAEMDDTCVYLQTYDCLCCKHRFSVD